MPPPTPALPANVVELRALLTKTQDKLADATNKKRMHVEAVRHAVFEAFEGFKVDPPTAHYVPTHGKSMAQEEYAVVHITDWQLGKRTATYNMEVAAKRIKLLAEKVITLARIQERDHPVRRCRVYATGDMVEGEGIFKGQAHTLDGGLYRQIACEGPRIFAGFLLDLLTFFDEVTVVCIPGNHGDIRMVGDVDPQSNADRILYATVRNMLLGMPDLPGSETDLAREGRLKFVIPAERQERSWYAVDRIGDWGCLLAHGNQVTGGFGGFPWYGTARAANGWLDAIPEPWDYLFMGHWHTPVYMTINYRKVFFGGSTESDSEYAREQCKAIGWPTQNLLFIHPRLGRTAQYEIDLEPRTPALARYEATREKWAA